MQQNMPNMKMDMHDTFWRDDQVMIVFHSDIPLISANGILNKDKLLGNLQLPSQLQRINQFLNSQLDPNNEAPIRLTFLDDRDNPTTGDQYSFKGVNAVDSSKLPHGVYLFSLKDAIKKDFGEIQTSIPAFFRIVKEPVQGDSKYQNNRDLVPIIVNTLNKKVLDLNRDSEVTIQFAAPTLLCGGVQVTHGCPLTPPTPVEGNCSDWHLEVPDLNQLESTGDGVTVFILDAIPERIVITNAAQNAGNTNGLLHNVNETVTFDYSQMSGVQGVFLMQHTNGAAVGKDIYGEHYPILMPDHGLFIAGIVRDIAPDANIECIRVLNDLCVGDMQALMGALWKIYKRVLQTNPDTNEQGDLYRKSVVINLSLVIPTDDEAQNNGIVLQTAQPGSPGSGFDNIWPEGLRQALQCLADAKDTNVITVASAGNEGDERELPTSALRPKALYPASLSDSIENVIAVGAVTKKGEAASYSCYPGSHSIAAWGGELPDTPPATGEVVPPNPGDPGSDHPQVTFSDAPRGIYSNILYPPLSAVPADPPEQYYAPPNQNGWAYWIGTSFATPIVSAAVAHVLEWKKLHVSSDSVYTLLKGLIPSTQVVEWNHLAPNDGTEDGPRLKVEQKCRSA